MSLVYWVVIDWRNNRGLHHKTIVLLIHVGLQLTKHILMMDQCLRRLPNFNPSMGLNASCFLVPKKNTSQSYHPAYHSPASSHWHRHRKRWASITDVGPALIQHWFNALCLLCLAIIGLEQCWASVNVGQWWDSDGSLYTWSSARIIMLCIVPLPKIYMRRSANVRPASQTVSQHKIDYKKNNKVEGRGSRVVGWGSRGEGVDGVEGFSRYPWSGTVSRISLHPSILEIKRIINRCKWVQTVYEHIFTINSQYIKKWETYVDKFFFSSLR